MYFFFFDSSENSTDNELIFTDPKKLQSTSIDDIKTIKYNRITDLMDLLRILVISRCAYLQGHEIIGINNDIVSLNPNSQKLFIAFNDRIGLSPNGTSIIDLYCNFVNHYDWLSQSNPDDIIAKYQTKCYEGAPIDYLKRNFGFDEETALIEYYWIFVSFELYHDEPFCEIYQKYVDTSKSHNQLSITAFCHAIHYLFYSDAYYLSDMTNVVAINNALGDLHADTPYRVALVYYYFAVFFHEFNSAVRDYNRKQKKQNSGARTNKKISNNQSPSDVFHNTYSSRIYDSLYSAIKITGFLDSTDESNLQNWQKIITETQTYLGDISLELYLQVFLPFTFKSPNTVISYLKDITNYSKISDEKKVIEIIVSYLYVREIKSSNPIEEFKRYLNDVIHTDCNIINYQDVYRHLVSFSENMAVTKTRMFYRYHKEISPIKELFKMNNAEKTKGSDKKLLDVYMYPFSYKRILDDNVLTRFERIPALNFLRIIEDNSEDSAIENGVLFDLYANSMVLNLGKNALLVQPSYSFLQKWITDYRTKSKKTTVVIYDSTIVECLNDASKNGNLVSWKDYHLDQSTKSNIEFINKLNKEIRFDIALAFYNRVPTRPDDLNNICQMMDHHSVLYTVMPEDYLNDERYICLKKWFFNIISIDHISLFNSQLFGIQPKKKMMIQCSHQSIYTEQRAEIPVTEYEIDKDLHQKSKNGKRIHPDGFLYYLKKPEEKRLKLNSQYLEENMGIREMLRRQELPESIISRNKAKEVSPAPDLTVYYTASPHGKATQVNCYFTRYLDPVKQKNNQKGKKIKESQEIFTVNDESEAELMILEDVLFRDKFRKVASEEIRSSHKKGFLTDLSLLSYAYAYPEAIKKRFVAYDDRYCINKLSHNRIGSLIFNSPFFQRIYKRRYQK